MNNIIKNLVALERLTGYLNGQSLPEEQGPGSPDQGDIRLAGVSSTYHSSDPSTEISTHFRLENINLELEPGTMTMIAGTNGSGKTLLLMTLLAETHISAGSRSRLARHDDVNPPRQRGLQSEAVLHSMKQSWLLPGAIAFGSQEAHIIHGSIKANISMGLPLWEACYRDTIAACAIDLAEFPDGDETEIGEGRADCWT